MGLAFGLAACEMGRPTPRASFGLAPSSIRELEGAGGDAGVLADRLEAALEEAFGTPAEPHYPREWGDAGPAGSTAEVAGATGSDPTGSDPTGSDPTGSDPTGSDPTGSDSTGSDAVAARAVPPATRERLARGAALYRRECQHCHGVAGGGDGPTGTYLRPQPRDYRSGLFKWTRVEYGAAPTHADLVRVLAEGVPGTSMASFRKLETEELERLADFVRLLAIRGQVERLFAEELADGNELSEDARADALELVRERWSREAVVELRSPVPPATPERLARGAELFRGAGECASCHGDEGAGDGEAVWELGPDGERRRRLDEWGQPSVPRDLRRGPYHGGSEPADLYRRIRAGISGTIMPGASTLLSEDDLWCLVHHVRSLLEE